MAVTEAKSATWVENNEKFCYICITNDSFAMALMRFWLSANETKNA